MRASIILLGMAVTATTYGQRCADLQLPQPRSVSLVVVDSQGEALENAFVEYLGNRSSGQLSTDSTGAMEFVTSAPAFVVRKVGYESIFVRPSDSTEPPRGSLTADVEPSTDLPSRFSVRQR